MFPSGAVFCLGNGRRALRISIAFGSWRLPLRVLSSGRAPSRLPPRRGSPLWPGNSPNQPTAFAACRGGWNPLRPQHKLEPRQSRAGLLSEGLVLRGAQDRSAALTASSAAWASSCGRSLPECARAAAPSCFKSPTGDLLRSPLTSPLILKRAPLGWNQEDYDVLEDGVIVGRIFKVPIAPQDQPWYAAAHGYESHARRGDGRVR
jgi:hypothetical protein